MTKTSAAILARLFAVQFFSWSAMFCLWIYAVPVIAGQVFRAAPDSAAYQTALVAVGLCYSVYAVLGWSLGFAVPRVVARLGAGTVHGLALLAGALGLGLLSEISTPALLVLSFALIGVAWGSISQLPYAIAAAAAPAGKGPHVMRLFGMSTVAPQLVTTMALALLSAHWIGEAQARVIQVGAGLMATAGLLCLTWRGSFATRDEEW